MKDKPSNEAIAPNAHWLLWAGFVAILASGIGFAIRGGILDNWARDYGFSSAQSGAITGMGLTGFCFGIIIGGIVADKIGYGKLVAVAFLLHFSSAAICFIVTQSTDPKTAFNLLYWGSFLYALANGTLEAVANPLVATLFPKNRTHYLNLLHAGWPAGLILGSVCSWVLDDQYQIAWQYQLALFAIPTVVYGLMFLGQHMPKSEASKQGLSLGEMFKDVGILGGLIVCGLLAIFLGDIFSQILGASDSTREYSHYGQYAGLGIGLVLVAALAVITKFSLGSILLFVLFIAHAMVGAVELGTDAWMQNITGRILSSQEGKILFVFTSSVMFALRFCADFIERKLRLGPVAILLTSAILACVGLNLTSIADGFLMAIVALTIYGVGKTFFWPTMLAVASDRFPRSGAVAISIMGGIGMLSAGLLGAPGLGFLKDKYAAEHLKTANVTVYEANKAADPSKFLNVFEAERLDARKVESAAAVVTDHKNEKPGAPAPTAEQSAIVNADVSGCRTMLRLDSLIPAAMALIYLSLIVYFTSIGGYKPLHLGDGENKGGH
jgi:MFS family permease